MTKSHNYKLIAFFVLFAAVVTGLWESAGSAGRGGGLTSATNDARRHFVLKADEYWLLAPPHQERFDASALAFSGGKLLTVSDRGPELYEIVFGSGHEAELRQTKLFPLAGVAQAARQKSGRFDAEGLALAGGYLYLSEESQRSVFRTPATGGPVERLPIEWAPVWRYFKGGNNASFEGVAVGDGKLYVANERQEPRIIVLDLETREIETSFYVDSSGFALGGPHYSDLAYFGGRLFVLDRNHRCILEVNPRTKKVEAEYAYGQMELTENLAYVTEYPTGAMEGLAVDEHYFWLVTDNNGQGRFQARADTRPTLFRCVRPRK